MTAERPIISEVFDALDGLPLFAIAPLYRPRHLHWGGHREDSRARDRRPVGEWVL